MLHDKDAVLFMFMHSAKTSGIFMHDGIYHIFTVNEAICYTRYDINYRYFQSADCSTGDADTEQRL